MVTSKRGCSSLVNPLFGLFRLLDMWCTSTGYTIRVYFCGSVYTLDVPERVYKSFCKAVYHPRAVERMDGLHCVYNYVESHLTV